MKQLIDSIRWHKDGGSCLRYIIYRIVLYIYGNTQRYIRHNQSGWLIEDNRPLFLRFLEWLEYSKWIENIDKLICKERNTSPHWHTYFDWSQGILIDSHEKALAVEKKLGYERVTVREWQDESKRQRKFIDEEHERIIEKKVRGVMHDIAQGRKFSQEVYAHREKVMKENGMTRLPGRVR